MTDEDSDDEIEISLDDLAYLRQVERRSYLLKRSHKNHKVWHKRYCVLSDKLWVINVRSEKPRAVRIDLNEPGKVHIVDDDFRGSNNRKTNNGEKVYEFVLESGSGAGAYHFRASSSKELSAWYDDLFHRTISSSEDSVIQMAELIMSEETRMRSERLKSSLSKALHSHVGKAVVDSTQQSIYNTNSEVIDKRKTVREQLSADNDTSYRSTISGKYAIYNGVSLPNDIERVEVLNNTLQEEDVAIGVNNRTVLGGMFRRRSGSGSNLTSERLFGSMDIAQGIGKPTVRVLSREASSVSLKALEGAALSAAASAATDRNNTEFLCRYYLESGLGAEGGISDDTTDEEDNNVFMDAKAEDVSANGSASATATEGIRNNVHTSSFSSSPPSYIQTSDVDVHRLLSSSRRGQRQRMHLDRPSTAQQQQQQVSEVPGSREYSTTHFYAALTLLHAIHNFKERRRKDAHMGPPSTQATQLQWQMAAALFQEFLSPRLVVKEADMGVDDPQRVIPGIETSSNCFGLSSSCVGKVAGAVVQAVEWCVAEVSGIDADQDGERDQDQDQDQDDGELDYRESERGGEVVEQGTGDARGLSQTSAAGSFWGAVFGTAPAAGSARGSTTNGASIVQNLEKRQGGEEENGHYSYPSASGREKFFLPFPSAEISPARSSFTMWGYLCTRKGAEVFHRQRVVACRVCPDIEAPPADLFDDLVRELEQTLNEGTRGG